MSSNKVKLVTAIVSVSIIALMFVVGAGLVKKITVGPDKAQIQNCKCDDCKCKDCKCCEGCCCQKCKK